MKNLHIKADRRGMGMQTTMVTTLALLHFVHITKTCLCNVLQFFMAVKKINFQMKNCDVFLIFAQNIDCGYRY